MAHLTVSMFLGSYSNSQIIGMFRDALWNQNAVALPVLFREAESRGDLHKLIETIRDSFMLNETVVKYKSSFAYTLANLMYEYRKVVPFFAKMYEHFTEHQKYNGDFTKNAFRNIYYTNNHEMYSMLTAHDLAHMKTSTWVAIYEYEKDVFLQENQEDLSDKKIRAEVLDILYNYLADQALEVACNCDLRASVAPRISDDLEIYEIYVRALEESETLENADDTDETDE